VDLHEGSAPLEVPHRLCRKGGKRGENGLGPNIDDPSCCPIDAKRGESSDVDETGAAASLMPPPIQKTSGLQER